MSKTHGFGIIGLGMIADFHAQAVNAMANGKVVACLSRNPDKATAFAARFGGTAYTDLDAMLADPALDIITVCTPSGAHADVTVAAARAGKHAIVEKPIEIQLPRIDRMIAAHEDAGTYLGGIFPYRYSDVVRQMKSAVNAGRFGRLSYGGAYAPWWRDHAYYTDGGWKGTLALDGGGAVMNQSIHAVDSLIWMMGDIEWVCAHKATLTHEIEAEDTAVAALKFKNGALGTIVGTTSSYPGLPRRLEVCGDNGSAVCVEDDLIVWQFRQELDSDDATRRRFTSADTGVGGAANPSNIPFINHQLNFQAFVDAIDAGEAPPIDGVESRRAVAVVLALYKSAAEQRPVCPDEL
jgi:predicted dehydrogenase